MAVGVAPHFIRAESLRFGGTPSDSSGKTTDIPACCRTKKAKNDAQPAPQAPTLKADRFQSDTEGKAPAPSNLQRHAPDNEPVSDTDKKPKQAVKKSCCAGKARQSSTESPTSTVEAPPTPVLPALKDAPKASCCAGKSADAPKSGTPTNEPAYVRPSGNVVVRTLKELGQWFRFLLKGFFRDLKLLFRVDTP